jgi:MoxR-like ATPase
MANATNNKIATFVNLCVTEGYKSPLSRSQIKALRAKYGCPMPAWLMKDEDRRVGHGKYACAELDAAWSTRNGVAAAASVPAPVSAPVAVAAPAAPAMQARIARAESTLDGNFIPSKLMTYVPYGNYKDIEAIVKSKRWYPTMVTGLSGNGKTTMIEQVCAKLGRECIRVNLTSQTDADDLLGGFRLVNGDTVWQDGPVVTAMKRGAILLLDEMDTASHKIMCLMRVLEGKGAFLPKINTQVEPATGFNVFATMNTKGQGGEGSEQFSSRSILDEALLERFSGTYEQDYPTKAVEKKIVLGNMEALSCVDEPFADCLVKWAEMIRKTYMEGGADAIITTRRLCMIVDNFSIFADRTKAVTAACARFSNSTKEAFVNLYTKVDAEVSTTADPARAAAMEAEAAAAAVAKATRFDLKGAAFQDRATVKNLGAAWDATAKVWYVTGDQYRANPSAFDPFKPTPVSA